MSFTTESYILTSFKRYVFKYENHIWLYYWKPKVTIVSALPLFIYSNVQFVYLMRMNNI